MTPRSGDIESATFPLTGMRRPSDAALGGEGIFHRGSMEKNMPLSEFAASLALIGALKAADAIADFASWALANIQG
jgi:hypothetical protein